MPSTPSALPVSSARPFSCFPRTLSRWVWGVRRTFAGRRELKSVSQSFLKQVKSKMILTFVGSLMAVDMNQKSPV